MITKSKSKTIIIKFLIIALALCCLAHSTQPNSNHNHNEYLLVLKNDKISVLNYNPDAQYHWNKESKTNYMWIYNDQQSISVEMAVGKKEQIKEEYIFNHTRSLPLWCELIKKKGYLRPYNPFDERISHMIKGYRYTKPAYHDTTIHQTYQQIQAFIKAIIQLNNITTLNLRMQDTFNLTITIISEPTNIKDYLLTGISVKYLFATVAKNQLPKRILKYEEWETVDTDKIEVMSHNEYARQDKFSTLERRLYGRGLHQWVNHTITLDDVVDIELQGLVDKCWYEFTDILPESTYIDSDQRRQQTTNYETINIEKPAFASKQYFYKYRVPLAELKQSGVRKYSYHQPIHFRYPSPSLLNYTKVYLHPIVDARIICDKDVQNNQQEQQNNQIVFRVEQNLLFERGTASIPNADISKAKIVSITTLVVCLVAVLVIIKNLKKN